MNKGHITNLTGKYETKTEHITAITTGETKGACITTVSIKQGKNRSRKLTIKHKGSAHHQRNDSRLHNTQLNMIQKVRYINMPTQIIECATQPRVILKARGTNVTIKHNTNRTRSTYETFKRTKIARDTDVSRAKRESDAKQRERSTLT